MSADTFKVVLLRTGGILNHVRVAENEKPDDRMEVRVVKRQAEAELKLSMWSYNYFNHAESLAVVPYDIYGRPLVKPVLQTAAERTVPEKRVLPTPYNAMPVRELRIPPVAFVRTRDYDTEQSDD